jgi:hypothetical protein
MAARSDIHECFCICVGREQGGNVGTLWCACCRSCRACHLGNNADREGMSGILRARTSVVCSDHAAC